MSNLKFRRLSATDMDLWFKMRIESLYDCPSAFLSSPEVEPKTRHKGTIWGMYVKSKYRGQRVGKDLLQLAVDFAHKNMNLIKVDLSVDSSRETAKRLYTSVGFKKWGREEMAVQIDGKYFDEEYLTLLLDKTKPAVEPRPL